MTSRRSASARLPSSNIRSSFARGSSRSCKEGSSSSGSSRRRKRSDPTALRKYVLKKEARKRMVDESLAKAKQFGKMPSIFPKTAQQLKPKNIFELIGKQRVRVKRGIQMEKSTICIFTTIYIYHHEIKDDSDAYLRALEESVVEEVHYKPNDRNLMERCTQRTYYGKNMIRIVRDMVIEKEFWDRGWTTKDDNKTEDFATRTEDGRCFESSVELKSRSENSLSGYRNATAFIISFMADGNKLTDGANMVRSALKQRKERPNLEELILVGESLENDGKSLKLLDEIHLLPQLVDMETGAYVEEIREYNFDPTGSDFGRLNPIDKSWRANNFQRENWEEGSSSFIHSRSPKMEETSHSALRQRSRSKSRNRTAEVEEEWAKKEDSELNMTTAQEMVSPVMNRPRSVEKESPDEEQTFYTPPQSYLDPNTPPLPHNRIHPIAIPGPQAFREGHPRPQSESEEEALRQRMEDLQLNETKESERVEPESGTATAREITETADELNTAREMTDLSTSILPQKEEKISPKKEFIPLKKATTRSVTADLDMSRLEKKDEVSMTMDVVTEFMMRHHHKLILSAEINGKLYNFTGNICFTGPAEAEFMPKRVLMDSKLLWEQSNEWNPTSVMDSQINLSKSQQNETKK